MSIDVSGVRQNPIPHQVENEVRDQQMGSLCGRSCTTALWALCVLPVVNTIVGLAGIILKLISKCLSTETIAKSKFWTNINDVNFGGLVAFAIPVFGNIVALMHCCKGVNAEERTTKAVCPSTHVNARAAHPDYVSRHPVPDDKVSWDKPFPEYNPPNFTVPKVLKASWADVPNPQDIPDLASRMSHIGFSLNENGVPINPVGRTGIAGRGLLGKWGPNHAADPVVILFNPETKQLELVVIWRKVEHIWAIPGGMVDPGEPASKTAMREFAEECFNLQGLTDEQVKAHPLLTDIFKDGVELYRGYSDDVRNTDNAWMETEALRYFVSENTTKLIHSHLKAGDDATEVKTMPIQYPLGLFASHDKIVRNMVEDLLKRKDIPCYSQVEKQLKDFIKAAKAAEAAAAISAV